jgi:hypothetical protein
MAKSIPCVWFRHLAATSFGSRSSLGEVNSQDGYPRRESIRREMCREDMGSPDGYVSVTDRSP